MELFAIQGMEQLFPDKVETGRPRTSGGESAKHPALDDESAIVHATLLLGKPLERGIRCSNVLNEDPDSIRCNHRLFSVLLQYSIALQLFEIKHLNPTTREGPSNLSHQIKPPDRRGLRK